MASIQRANKCGSIEADCKSARLGGRFFWRQKDVQNYTSLRGTIDDKTKKSSKIFIYFPLDKKTFDKARRLYSEKSQAEFFLFLSSEKFVKGEKDFIFFCKKNEKNACALRRACYIKKASGISRCSIITMYKYYTIQKKTVFHTSDGKYFDSLKEAKKHRHDPMKVNLITYSTECTDTFGGEPNYSWVRRAEFSAPDNATRRQLMRRAKRELGISGIRGRTYDHGDVLEFRPYRCPMVLYIEPK